METDNQVSKNAEDVSSRLLLRRSEFEPCWLLKFYVPKDKNNQERGWGWPIFKKVITRTTSSHISD